MSEGLSQDDFRKLLATPRRPNDDNTQFKAPAPKTPKNNTGAIFAQPRSMRKKGSFKKGSNNKAEEQDPEENEQPKYRDRAAERRKQDNTTISEDHPSTTEALLQQTQLEAGEELDSKQIYEQSKYLGGDVDHTHLVKGLDFALLRKVRADLNKKQQQSNGDEQQDERQTKDTAASSKQHSQDMSLNDGNGNEEDDDELDQVLDRFERGEKVADDTTNSGLMEENQPKFHTLMAKNIYQYIQHQTNPEEQQPRVELFEPGRMAFVFELADEVGHYSDAFAIPTSMIRSKTDVAAKLSRSGWSEENQAESSLVMDKISQVMNRVRHCTRADHHSSIKKKSDNNNTIKILKDPVPMVVDDGFMGDIFADAGRDYELDESTVAGTAAAAADANVNANEAKGNYFKDLVDEKEDQEMAEASNDAVNALLSQATGIEQDGQSKQDTTTTTNKRKYDHIEMDADAADIDMFGLSSSALPTSFEEHTTAYQSGDDDDNDADDTASGTKQKERSATQMMDQGTNKNKKAQLTRWDFDTEDEWQNYKDNIEIHPKSAYQYGIKLGDGRKRNKERKGMSDKQRLDRDYQQVKNIMSKKYGKSL
ncbi:hypothetical protein [Parasitella parasitica]|uniref:RED-like N-terminal domain-containing protein n=1 Tax=Parasitella parasitica TaxID=35722 RepID=A0A0B7N5K2_9FUNG|nr:hypothetical protein [Parasitella parasitica]